MNRSVFSIIVLALIAHSCVAEIVIKTSKPKHLTKLYDAAVDIVTTCYGDLGNAVGIRGDLDGSILEALRFKYFIPVALIEHEPNKILRNRDYPNSKTLHELKIFVIAIHNPTETWSFFNQLSFTVWWNPYANFLFIDASPNNSQCSKHFYSAGLSTYFGLLNTQFICHSNSLGVMIYSHNPFTRQAPPVWKFVGVAKLRAIETPVNIFKRRYRKGGQACEALNFPKTIDIGGSPVRFLTRTSPAFYDINNPLLQNYLNGLSYNDRKQLEATLRDRKWFMDTIVRVLNGTAVIVQYDKNDLYHHTDRLGSGLLLHGAILSSNTQNRDTVSREMMFPLDAMSLFALTKHTDHKPQLIKILTVIDGYSRIGMLLVYIVTFLFFKFFLGQTVMPALLNLVRLTCDTGLPKLPQNLAPTIYLACLLMFVVTLQGIYTGNLATLLTTTIAYRNVETRGDIPYLGYTVYTPKNTNLKLAADPSVSGHVVETAEPTDCLKYVKSKPLSACVLVEAECVLYAIMLNAHISRDPIVEEYYFYYLVGWNPLGRRLESIMRRWVEHDLLPKDLTNSKLRVQFLHDDEVKKNTFRRVMTVDDLCFAFVILGIGLLCSFICFIGEILVCKIRLKIAKRRNRVRARLAWGVKKKSFLSFPSLSCRFNVRRLFSKRR